MAKNIVVVTASPRVGKFTDKAADAFIEGAKSAGHSVKKFSLAKNRVGGCLHCMQCGKNGYCSQKDGMEEFYPMYEEADVIVFASPIYFWHITAQMKAFIDRLYTFYVTKTFSKKEMAVILVSGGKGESMSEEAVSFFKNVFEKRIGWTSHGTLLIDGTTPPDFDLEKAGFAQKAFDFGASIQ